MTDESGLSADMDVVDFEWSVSRAWVRNADGKRTGDFNVTLHFRAAQGLPVLMFHFGRDAARRVAEAIELALSDAPDSEFLGGA